MPTVFDISPSGLIMEHPTTGAAISLVPPVHALATYSGTLNLPYRSADYRTHLQGVYDHTIATGLPSACNSAEGGIRIEWPGDAGYSYAPASADTWWDWRGTVSIYHATGDVETGSGANQGYLKGSSSGYLASYTDLTALVVSGSLIIRERVFIRGNISAPLYGPFQRQAVTIHYTLDVNAVA